jgi:hypothetical protein
MQRTRRLPRHLLLVLALTALLAPPVRGQPFDHLTCYKVRDPAARALYVADLTPRDGALPVESGCSIRVPAKLLCVDVRKTNVSPPPPGAPAGAEAQKYLCYKVRCEKGERVVSSTDQFGARDVVVRTARLVCAPVQATTVTSSSTTTTSTLPATRCCQIGPGSLGCFDGLEPVVEQTCHIESFVAPPGTVCDGVTGSCGSVKRPGSFCCDCGGAVCIDASDPVMAQLCVDVLGCTIGVGQCGVLTQTCGGL